MGLPPIEGEQFDIPSVSMPGGMSAVQGDNAAGNIDGGEDIA
jgi:hypothetical protein